MQTADLAEKAAAPPAGLRRYRVHDWVDAVLSLWRFVGVVFVVVGTCFGVRDWWLRRKPVRP